MIQKYVSIQPMLGVKLSIIVNENMSVNDGGCKARMHFFNILKHKVLTEVNAVRMSRQLCANECKRENCIIQ